MTKPKRPFKPTAALLLAGFILTASLCPADARGGHGFGGHGFGGMHGAAGFVGGRRHGDDAYTRAALAEEEKLLAKLKNICRGC